MQQVHIEPFNLIGVSIRTTNANGQAEQEIAALWQRFIGGNLLAEIPNKTGDAIYSLYTDYEGDHTQPYTSLLGCSVKNLDEIPEGMTGRSFAGGTYIKTTANGDLAKGLIVKHWSKIFEMELDRAFVADFEVFGEKARNPSKAEVDFYVGIK